VLVARDWARLPRQRGENAMVAHEAPTLGGPRSTPPRSAAAPIGTMQCAASRNAWKAICASRCTIGRSIWARKRNNGLSFASIPKGQGARVKERGLAKLAGRCQQNAAALVVDPGQNQPPWLTNRRRPSAVIGWPVEAFALAADPQLLGSSSTASMPNIGARRLHPNSSRILSARLRRARLRRRQRHRSAQGGGARRIGAGPAGTRGRCRQHALGSTAARCAPPTPMSMASLGNLDERVAALGIAGSNPRWCSALGGAARSIDRVRVDRGAAPKRVHVANRRFSRAHVLRETFWATASRPHPLGGDR